jgi:tRNA (cytidine/uridine-2'-O-)-methyltransferase
MGIHDEEVARGAGVLGGGAATDATDATDVDAVSPINPINPINPIVSPVVHLVLDRPAIAGNVGACVRLCAAVGAALHVCGSQLDPADRTMWRAGLDYWPRARVHFHDSLARCLALLPSTPWIVEVGGAKTPWDADLRRGAVIVIGPEKGSVDDELRLRLPERVITLPQQPGIRSLNMAQCAAVVVFEAVRQQRASQV